MTYTRTAKCLLACAAVLWAGAAGAQDFERNVSNKGTVAAAFLEIGVGARAEAMGGAYTAQAGSAEMIYWNPAGLAYLQGPGVTFTHTEWLASTSFDFAAFATPVPFFNGVLGLSFTTLGVPEQEVRTVEDPEGTGQFYDARDFAATVSFSARIIRDFSVGVSGKYVSQRIWSESAAQAAFDAGVYYQTPLEGLNMGASISNFGPDLRMSGKNLTNIIDPDETNTGIENIPVDYRTDAHPLPQIFRFGLSYRTAVPGQGSLTTAVNLMHPTGSTESMNLGLEYGWNDLLFLRAGYQNLFERNAFTDFFGGEPADKRHVNGLTLGSGLQFTLKNRSRIVFDYAWSDWTLLQSVHRVSLAWYGR